MHFNVINIYNRVLYDESILKKYEEVSLYKENIGIWINRNCKNIILQKIWF